MTSKKRYKLYSLLFETTSNYEVNLKKLLQLIEKCDENSIVVAGEVCLTGYDYENFDEVISFAEIANEAIKKVSKDKIIILSIIEKKDGEIFNFAKIFYNGEIVYQRAKARLFRFGDEHKFMSEGDDEDIKIVEIDGIKIAIFVCFELRFKELWQNSEGADVIAVVAWWGVLRSEHFKALTQTLAILNQCYVIASDSLNDECTKMSGIINPQGEVKRNGNISCLEIPYNKKEILTMRRYMDIGLNG